MQDVLDLTARMSDVSRLLKEKLGVRGVSLAAQLRRARYRLPRRIRQQAKVLQEAEALSDHPRLALTLDDQRYAHAADVITDHLKSIDVKDRRKGFWLGVLGGVAFNLLVAIILFLIGLKVLGYV
ncbi:MAG: hypothetical protein CML66_18960 [Rhodobacteraceae bacterium]|nr:hypothetical protein [Paracoccaceae bacterium]MAY45531.1 hypothetical protein [Paracoccaceae bacterium]